MASPKCPVCGRKMARNGKTSAGHPRWRCTGCGASSTRRADSTAKRLDEFLGRLLGRRRTAGFWSIWPMPPKVEAPRRVIHLDGIHLGRKACALVTCDDAHALGWHLCRSENSLARSALMSRIAAPDVAVSGGGDGFARALRRTWPGTAHQRSSIAPSAG